jgi:hypothetical protein
VHLLVDSTGLKLCGPGEWLVEKHGTRTRRSWRKFHIGVDAGTRQIIYALRPFLFFMDWGAHPGVAIDI